MKITLVRHGQTIENAKKMVMGHNDGKLNKLGIKQAKAVGKYLRHRKFDVIYSSDLGRVKETLGYIKEYHPTTPIVYTKKMRERGFGVFEGKKFGEYSWDDLSGTYTTRRPKGGEFYNYFRDRVRSFIKLLKKKHMNDNILVVSHSGSIRLFLGILKKVRGEKITEIPRTDNCGICEVSITSKKTIIHCINKISHLKK